MTTWLRSKMYVKTKSISMFVVLHYSANGTSEELCFRGGRRDHVAFEYFNVKRALMM